MLARSPAPCCPAPCCSPEYSTQGFHPTLWHTLTTTLDGPEVAIFKVGGVGVAWRAGGVLAPSQGEQRCMAAASPPSARLAAERPPSPHGGLGSALMAALLT